MPFSISSSDHRIVTTWTHRLCVGRLVAYKHLGQRPPGDKARLAYKDWNKTNDSADNLAWSDHTSVTKACYATTPKPVYKLAALGAARTVTYASAQEAAADVGVKNVTIYKAIVALAVPGGTGPTWSRGSGRPIIHTRLDTRLRVGPGY